MRQKLLPWMLALLAAYSGALIATEVSTSQEYVRQFFDDVSGPVPFFAVNTTLTVFLLWGTALMFGVAAALAGERPSRKAAYWFYVSQVAVFVYLGCDDRFKLHELIGRMLDVGDHYILLAVGTIETLLLATIARPCLTSAAWRRLIVAACLFAVMILIDAKAPHDLMLRLSFEDLSKTWSCVAFLLFAWESVRGEIAALAADLRTAPERDTTERPATLPRMASRAGVA